jgi:tRNA(Ile)-lysidine synthase
LKQQRSDQAGKLPDIFSRALGTLLPATGNGEAPAGRIAVALSGGLDSSALLHLAHQYAHQHALTLYAFHVHHGLSANADAWLDHCERRCAALGAVFDARRITLQRSGNGTEEAARAARYAALGAMCAEHGVNLLLTAHHQDDQAETVLLQLLRGSGTAGLSGMDEANRAPGLLGNPDLVMARPLLPAPRKALEDYVAANGIAYVDDESNTDARFARNALRHQVMPALAAAFPGFQERFARSASHAQSAQRLLVELGAQDLALCADGDGVDIGRLRELTQDRAYNLLRYWFGKRGWRMPSAAWLAQMLAQVLDARHDAQVLVSHPDCHVRRHRNTLYLVPRPPELAGQRDRSDEGAGAAYSGRPGQRFAWQGEAFIDFPAYGGRLHFDPATRGFEPAWLRSQPLDIDFRKGGERLKLAANRPTKGLKYHYQAFDVPSWERERLPTVSTGKQLLFAAGIGMDCKHLLEADAENQVAAAGQGTAMTARLVALRWESMTG